MDVKDCTDPDKDVLESDWHVAVFQAAQAAKARGDLPNSLELLLQKMREAKIDWKAILRRFMQTFCSSDYSWKRPNRRYLSFGMYLPALQSEQMGPLVIGWDTSGSTLHKQQEFAAEVAEIISEIKPERTYVVYNDARAQRVEEFGPDDQIEFHPQGGGGTNFIPVFDWIEKSMVDPSCLVFFTDLDGRFPAKEPDYPVLWLDCEGRCVAPFGEVVRMDKEG
ncbi:hypothetical protein GTO10_06520 [Candidatus Saccharibacteria bacterium]|nr:hypothetical protein [Candidatus Saccharibacteria bacterium]